MWIEAREVFLKGAFADFFSNVHLQVKDVTNGISMLHGVDPSSWSMSEKHGKRKKQKKNLEESSKENSEGKANLWCRQLSGEGRHLDKHRVILRNLPFGVSGLYFLTTLLMSFTSFDY